MNRDPVDIAHDEYHRWLDSESMPEDTGRAYEDYRQNLIDTGNLDKVFMLPAEEVAEFEDVIFEESAEKREAAARMEKLMVKRFAKSYK